MINTLNQGVLNLSNEPVGNAYRNVGSDLFNAGFIAREDWQRNEQAQNNQLLRDLYFQERGNAFTRDEAEKTRSFNASEAQKQRDYDERMSNTQYQRAVEDMKIAGLNPVLALGGSGASFHGGSSASSAPSGSSSARSSTGNNRSSYASADSGQFLNSLLSIVAGLYSAGAKNATELAVAKYFNS